MFFYAIWKGSGSIVMVECEWSWMNFKLQLPKTTTRILLNHFKWDKEKLLERYFESNQDSLNQVKFFKDAHVVNPFNKPKLKNKPKVRWMLKLNSNLTDFFLSGTFFRFRRMWNLFVDFSAKCKYIFHWFFLRCDVCSLSSIYLGRIDLF